MRWVKALPMKPLTPRMRTFMEPPSGAEALAGRDARGQRERDRGQLRLPVELQGDEAHGAIAGRDRDAVRIDGGHGARLGVRWNRGIAVQGEGPPDQEPAAPQRGEGPGV